MQSTDSVAAVAGEKLMEYLPSLVEANASRYGLVVIGYLGVTGLSCLALLHCTKKLRTDGDEFSESGLLWVLGAIFSGLLLAISAFCFLDLLTYATQPEVWSLKDLVGSVK